jgi:hypothetical protein
VRPCPVVQLTSKIFLVLRNVDAWCGALSSNLRIMTKLEPLPLIVVFAALTPSLAFSQNPQVTLGVKSVKEKAYLDGPHSTVVASSSPVIEIDLPKGDTIDNYILVQMDGKGDRRELEVESRGGIVGGKNGIRAEAIHKTYVTSLGGNKFQLGTDTLKKGQYLIYVVGSPDSIKGIYGRGYDFTVQ